MSKTGSWQLPHRGSSTAICCKMFWESSPSKRCKRENLLESLCTPRKYLAGCMANTCHTQQIYPCGKSFMHPTPGQLIHSRWHMYLQNVYKNIPFSASGQLIHSRCHMYLQNVCKNIPFSASDQIIHSRCHMYLQNVYKNIPVSASGQLIHSRCHFHLLLPIPYLAAAQNGT